MNEIRSRFAIQYNTGNNEYNSDEETRSWGRCHETTTRGQRPNENSQPNENLLEEYKAHNHNIATIKIINKINQRKKKKENEHSR